MAALTKGMNTFIIMKYILHVLAVSLTLFFLGVFIVAAKRTPFGTFGGKFLKLSSCDLQEVASKAALSAGKISPDIIDSVVIGNVLAVRI